MPSLGFDVYSTNVTSFVNLFYAPELVFTAPVKWAGPTGWPDTQALMQAVAVRNGRSSLPVPDLIAIYGSYSPEEVNVNGIKCFFDMRSGRANVTYHLNAPEVVDVRPDEDSFSYLPNTGNCDP